MRIFKKQSIGAALLGGALSYAMIGCVEPPYRNDVTTNGQGQVEVHRVPKDPIPDVAQPSPAPTVDAKAESTTDQRISDLEREVRELKAEVEQLKQRQSAIDKKAN